MRDKIDGSKMISGQVRLFKTPDSDFGSKVRQMLRRRHPDPAHPRYAHGWVPQDWDAVTGWMHNDILYEWGTIFASLLMRKGLNYGIGGMYIEFENVASPGDPVSAPTVTRNADEGVEYYNALSGSGDRDYLRVPLIASSLGISDATNFPKGNEPSFFAQTTGVEGVHGKTFSDAVNSTVFGGALVAFVDETDPTQDLVLSRFYAEVASQQVKLSTGQVGFQWKLTLN